ncbi:uncharacterized protein METZ01_LOCUS965 [marine metagenome]|uniref:Secretion system C-terminal sorting domain-containing protein n=1 Tax=marine metagenome TaxID=408172 RepID=A0A381N0L1_9ZZZZ|tara:strand:+ start:6196 stop:7923 length:1728 start_codon:yes stop_codon:yes gene_type:complete
MMKKNNICLFKVFIFFISISYGKQLSVHESWKYLLDINQAPIHATHHVNNIIRNGIIPEASDKISLLSDLGIKIYNNNLTPVAPNYLEEILETENYYFHYTTDQSNADAISPSDLNNNSIPDYVETMSEIFEYVWIFFEDTLGYSPPLDDNQPSGSQKYDIYIENLPTNYFAITYTSAFINESETSCSSYIKMRNNYNGSVFQGITELENIKITAVHEFFHAIQFSYNCFERFWLMEATAVWSEDEIYNNINDHYRYMTTWFQNSSRNIDDESNHMYGSFILFQYIDEHLGGPDMIKAIWEESRSRANSINDISFVSIDAALSSFGSNVNTALNSMRIANRIMSSHPNAEPYTYQEAENYPVTAPYEITSLSFNNNNPIVYEQNSLTLYSSNYIKLNILSPSRILIENKDGPNSDLFGAIIFKHENENNWTIRKGYDINIDPSINIEWATLLVGAQGQSEDDWDYKVTISNGYNEDLVVSSIYPNPFIYTNSKIGIKILSVIPQKIQISIYNILGKNIVKWSIDVGEPNEKVIFWDRKNGNRKIVSDGIYFIEITGKHKRIVKKFTLLKSSDGLD